MKQELIETGDLSYAPCRYGASRILFRGPRRRLDLPYISFIGSTETYGKFIETPFPALVEKSMRQICVNFGCVNGGIDAFVNDPTVMEICSNADLTVIQIMGANSLSNRFYAVHPRRNDRFLRPSTVLQAIYPEVDFSGFSFNRHMLGTLQNISMERFETVVAELREAWMARMKSMITQIGENCMLLWFSEEALTDDHWSDRPDQLQVDPLFITATMIDELRPMVKDVVVTELSKKARAEGTAGMVFPVSQAKAASEMLGARCHAEASAALIPKVREQLYTV